MINLFELGIKIYNNFGRKLNIQIKPSTNDSTILKKRLINGKILNKIKLLMILSFEQGN